MIWLWSQKNYKLQKIIPDCKEVFEQAPFDKKKMMLSSIIDKVEVYRDSIEIQITMDLRAILASREGQHIAKYSL